MPLRPGRVIALVAAGVLLALGLVPTVVAVAADGWMPNVGFLAFQVMLTFAGVLLWPHQDSRRTATLLLLAGLLIGVSNLMNGRYDETATYGTQVGWTFQWASVVPLAAVLLAYPGDRLAHRSDRALLALLATWAVGLRVVGSLLWDPAAAGYSGPQRWWTVYPANSAARLLEDWSIALLSGLMLWWVVVMARRWRSARGPTRSPVRQVVVAGVLLGVGLLARESAARAVGAGWAPPRLEQWTAGLHTAGGAAVALVLVVAALRAATHRGAVVEQLLAAGGDPDAVQQVLRRVLADPTLQLRFAVGDAWVGIDGEPMDADESQGSAAGGPSERAEGETSDDRFERSPRRCRRVLLEEDGLPVVEVDADEEVEHAPASLRVTLAAASMVLANTRLSVERAAHLEEVSASRARIVEAGVAQRRALERDLHDGAQQTLLAVAATLSRAAVTPGAEGMRAAVGDAQSQLAEALAEVRRLARGVHPAAVSQGGLGSGLQSIADGTDRVRVELDDAVAGGRRFPAAVETTAYYVVAEAVTNALKHADGAPVLVTVGADANAVAMTIADDGPGGAQVERGGGLAGLQDRVRALGGTFALRSASASGTCVTVVLPLAGRGA